MTEAADKDMTDVRRLRARKWRLFGTKAEGQTPIVPDGNISATALVFVIAIMTFLACLTLGAVTVVSESAASWQLQIAREATIQIKPEDGPVSYTHLTLPTNREV